MNTKLTVNIKQRFKTCFNKFPLKPTSVFVTKPKVFHKGTLPVPPRPALKFPLQTKLYNTKYLAFLPRFPDTKTLACQCPPVP